MMVPVTATGVPVYRVDPKRCHDLAIVREGVVSQPALLLVAPTSDRLSVTLLGGNEGLPTPLPSVPGQLALQFDFDLVATFVHDEIARRP